MHRKNGARARGDRRLDPASIEIAGIRLDIDEDRPRAGFQDRGRRRGECHGRGDHLVARPDVQGQQRHVKGAGAACHSQNMPPAKIIGERPLEFRDLARPW